MNNSPHPYTLRQLQYAVAVAETRNFRRAAERCHTSQPSLSAQVAVLEDALGVRLFERDRRGVLLTAAGKELVERAKLLLLGADDLLEMAKQARDPFSGTLRVGVLPTIAPYWLPGVTRVLSKAFPRLTLLWMEDRTAALVQGLAHGGLDAAVVAREADLGDVEGEDLAVDAFDLATAPGDPLGESKGKVTVADLRGAKVLVLEEGHCLGDQARAFCARTRLREADFRATSMATLAQLVASGEGVTLLPRLAVPTEARRFGLRVRPFADPKPRRTLALVWRRGSAVATALREIAGLLREAWPSEPPER